MKRINKFLAVGTAIFGVLLTTDAPAEPEIIRPTWEYRLFEDSIIRCGIRTGKTSAGVKEFYVGTVSSSYGVTTRRWYAVQYVVASGQYQPIFASEHFPNGLSRIECEDVLGDERQEIIVLSGGELHIYDVDTKQKLGTYSSGVTNATHMTTANLDWTGKKEIIVSSASNLAAWGAGEVLWSKELSGSDLSDICTGQMDNDAAVEIALSNGQIIDGSSQELEWDYGQEFGWRLQAGDIDGDGRDELITVERWDHAWAFDVERKLPKWSFPTGNTSAMALANTNGDSQPEIILGSYQGGFVYAVDSQTHERLWTIDTSASDISDIAVADFDSDGQNEVLWGGWAYSTEQDRFYIMNPETQALEWQSLRLDGPFIGPEVGDLDGDGRLEMVVISSGSDNRKRSARFLIFDNDTLDLRAISEPICDGRAGGAPKDLKLRDMDGDGNMEILIAADVDRREGAMEIYEYFPPNVTKRIWHFSDVRLPDPYFLDVADIDDDGTTEIISVGNSGNVNQLGVYLRAHKYGSATLLWELKFGDVILEYPKDMALANVDDDPALEVVVITEDSGLFVVDTRSHELEWYLEGYFRAMGIKDGSIFLASHIFLRQYKHEGDSFKLVNSTQLHPDYYNSPSIGGFEVLSIDPLKVQFAAGRQFHLYENGEIRLQSELIDGHYDWSFGQRFVDGVTVGDDSVIGFRLPAPRIHEEPEFTTGTWNSITWDQHGELTEYRAESSTTPGFINAISTPWIEDNNQIFNDLEPGQPYYYRVRGRSANGFIESYWSEVVSSYQASPGPAAATDWNLYD